MRTTITLRPLLLRFLVAGLMLLAARQSLATHAMGADITYVCTGPGQYLVTLTFFRDCAGITPVTTQTINYSSATCNVSGAFNLTQPTAAVDVTPICPSEVSSCQANPTSSFGIQQYTYKGTLKLPTNCGADWVLTWANCCRNFAITTLNNPGVQPTHITATLNNTLAPCNSSPVFNNIPTPIVCVGEPVFYNHGVTDPDGDQLVFSLANCMQDAGVPVSYFPGFSATNPLSSVSGVTIDPVTGAIAFIPSQIQIGVLCVKVEEYRNGVKIGETVRDMQFSVIACNNAAPVASGINGNSADFDIDACVGGNFCFNILMSDPNGDNVTASWNAGIPGGTFSITGNGTQTPSASFCWTPTLADTGTHFFTVSVRDDNCPLNGEAIYAFTIRVKGSLQNLNVSGPHTLCQGNSVPISALTAGASNYQWSPATGLSATNVASPLASPLVTTVYTVSASFPDGCTATKFVTVNVNPGPVLSVSPPVSYACPGSTVAVSANAPTAVSYTWNNGTAGPTLNVTPAASTTYTVTAQDAAGCTAVASATVNVSTPSANVCNVIYASPGATGDGSPSNPASLQSALNLAACNNVLIKLDIGRYKLSNPILNITNNLTLEGGFDRLNGWRKTSQPGATTIHRDSLNPQGLPGQERLVAFEIKNATGFRLQDLTVTTANGSSPGMSTYGIHIQNCSNYVLARCQVLPGNASAGANGAAGAPGVNGTAGANGLNGAENDDTKPGAGGAGGAGAGAAGTFGAGGAGGIDVNGPTACCLPGDPGDPGAAATNVRSGGGGGGGGSGGEESNNGGVGGKGGNGGGGAIGGNGGNGGPFGDPGFDGFNGNAGANGTPGGAGTNGPAGTHVNGFWVPGANGTNGNPGTGGAGGGGGGGGGGQNSIINSLDGAGNGAGGGGGGGQGGEGGTGGGGGGSSYAVYLYNNGANAQFLSCRFLGGTAGAGGIGANGGAGGTGANGGLGSKYVVNQIGAGGDGGKGGNGGAGGKGGDGQPGQSAALHQNGGTAPATSDIAFNLAAQPVIRMDDVACTNTLCNFSAPASNLWNLGAGASPNQFPTGTNVSASFSNVGRFDITYAGALYRGFGNIAVSGGLLPDGITTAPLVGSEHRLCVGDVADFIATNGAPGYVYNWDFGGAISPNTYVGSSFDNINNLLFVTPGLFKIVLKYQTNCCGLSAADTIRLRVEAQPVLNITGPTAFCAGSGGVALNASGGTSYVWSPSVGLSANSGPSVLANPSATTAYSVTAYSANGYCYDTKNVTVTVRDLSVSATPSNAGCLPNGSATALAGGGSGSYAYLWNTTPAQAAATATGLSPGTYQVRVTDNVTGCKDSAQASVGQNPGTLSAFVNQSVAASCATAANGSATVSVSGAAGVLTYAWSPSGGNAATATNLAPGTYTVAVSDLGNGCQTLAQATIASPPPINITPVAQTNADCNTFGEAEVLADGGTGILTYSWNTVPPQDSNVVSGLQPGTYSVTVTDDNGCSSVLPLTIAGPQSPVVLALSSITPATNCVTPDGSATVTGTGSGGNISYLWSTTPPQSGPVLSGVYPGNYTVTAIGSNGCLTDLLVNVGPTCPLALDWLSLAAEWQENYSLLSWEGSADPAGGIYEIQRAATGGNFEAQGRISSSGALRYTWQDRHVMPGERYRYRILHRDADGTETWSNTEEVQVPADLRAQVREIYPVPAETEVLAACWMPEAGELRFEWIAASGASAGSETHSLPLGSSVVKLNISQLASGVYQVRTYSRGEDAGTFRIVKISR